MLSLENAVPDTLEELELDEIFEYDIREVEEDVLYYVTFQEKENGNNKVVISVEYKYEPYDLLDDNALEGEVDVNIVERDGIGPMTAQVIMELLAITLDADYYDSDSDSEEDDETLSEPRTPPSRFVEPSGPPPLPRRRR